MGLLHFTPNLYHILYIVPLSSKSNNVPSKLCNCMQCVFFESRRYIFWRNDMWSRVNWSFFLNKWGWKSHFILKPQNPNPTLLLPSFIFQKPHFLGNQTSLTKILSQKTFHNLELGPLTKKKKKKLKKKIKKSLECMSKNIFY